MYCLSIDSSLESQALVCLLPARDWVPCRLQHSTILDGSTVQVNGTGRAGAGPGPGAVPPRVKTQPKRCFKQKSAKKNVPAGALFAKLLHFTAIFGPKALFLFRNACKSLQNIYLWCPASVTFSFSNRGQGACAEEAGPLQPIRGQDPGHMITADQ